MGTGLRAGFLVAILLFCVGAYTPHAHAAVSIIHWNYLFDEANGTVNPDAEVAIQDGGTYAVPLNAPGDLRIETEFPEVSPYWQTAGEVFFINPDTGEREIVPGFFEYGFAWPQEGTYEIDVYRFFLTVNRSPFESFLAWLIPVAHAAQPYWTFVETIRFEIVEGPIPSPPCCSSVLFLPGIEGSALSENGDVRWPSISMGGDVARLALDESGESVNDIQVAGVLSNFLPGVDVYGGFASHMDSLSENDGGDGTIQDWTPFGYDWRYALQRTLDEGAFWESEGEFVDLVTQVENLAAESKTGKVTIVAHSMGGLLGKALIKRLEEWGMDEYVDAFVMVGTPQLGTPEALAGLLHGRQPWEMELVMRSHIFRSIGRNMESAHTLLPSEAYFAVSGIPSPIIFNESADFTDEWRNRWGTSIDNATELHEFLTGTGVTRERPSETNLAIPEVLREELVDNVETFHSDFDNYNIPSHIRVVQVAGWGVNTLKSIEYREWHGLFDGYEPHFTVEGDETVVYPSALATNGEEYYFDLATFNALESESDRQHRDLTSAQPILSLVDSVIRKDPVSNTYIRTSKPNPGDVAHQLLVSTKSPVVLGAYDSVGNFTGVDFNQNLGGEVLHVTQDIPGSTFFAYGEEQYIFLPEEGSYTFKFKGTGSGPATVETSTFSNDEITPIATYTDIPVTTETEATFVVDSETPQETIIEVDANGDGTPETTVAPDGYIPPPPPSEPTVEELINTLKTKIQGLNINPKLKNKLLKRIEHIEKKINKQKQWKSKILENLEAAILKKAEKGRIDSMSASEIIALLDELETSVAVFPLNPLLVQELREKITNLNIVPKVKTNLLKRVNRLEKMAGLLHSLEHLTIVITNKGTQGKIPDTEVQELLNLLMEIENQI